MAVFVYVCLHVCVCVCVCCVCVRVHTCELNGAWKMGAFTLLVSFLKPQGCREKTERERERKKVSDIILPSAACDALPRMYSKLHPVSISSFQG